MRLLQVQRRCQDALVCLCLPGSQAFVLRDESYPQLEKLKEDLQEYLRNVTSTVNEKIDFIRRLEITQSLVDQLHKGYAKVEQRVRNLKTELPTEVTQGYEHVVGVSMGLVEKGLGALRGLKNKVAPATDKLAESFYDIVVPYANVVLEKVDSYTGAMRQAVTEATSKVQNPKLAEKLKQLLEDLRNQLVPYTNQLQNQLEGFQASLEPHTNRVQEKFKQGMERIKQTFQPWVDS
ncbi:uncharacterized protein LOC121918295, partial [Sceloporus undulatus]|uniref:uncharacterized protein LOC121918295 n=1 Tax=Sceloporus undulatus TaxID=8520 RepID=UPI001C4BF2AE